MLIKLTAKGLKQETIENLEDMEFTIERKRLEAEQARKEYERKLHDYDTHVGVYNEIVKSLNHSHK